MKMKQPNLLQYMNFSKKNKSTNKGQNKTIMSNYINSFSNKYPTYLQSCIIFKPLFRADDTPPLGFFTATIFSG